MSLLASADETARSFTGQLLRPSDENYDDLRRVHNGLIDKHPALIARCGGVADVVDAVALARTLGLEVAVRGGGHNVAGHATVDQGLLIDLSAMKGIHVDVSTRTVRADGGVLWRELNRETQLHGLATTGGVVGSTVGAGAAPAHGVTERELPLTMIEPEAEPTANLLTSPARVPLRIADSNIEMFSAVALAKELIVRVAPLPLIVAVPITSRLP